MIECIFTIDYEIYGNGEGSLKDLVYEPAEMLMAVFRRWNVRFVPFVEVAELEIIEFETKDRTIELLKHQIRKFHKEGFEIGLHMHPQWYNARYDNKKWLMDYSEYNLCTLSRERMAQIVERGISYLRNVLGESDFTPLSFRAGNWLFQPAHVAANVLAEHGIKVDSSVFKGGFQHRHKLDYRRALKNGLFWRFTVDANTSDPKGVLLELPIYTKMVPFWKKLTGKRIGMEKNISSATPTGKKRLGRIQDFLRFRYPLKFDFCRMNYDELTDMIDALIRIDQKDPTSLRPIVAIGHTKELVDFKTVDTFLSFLSKKRIAVSTFKDIYHRCCFCD